MQVSSEDHHLVAASIQRICHDLSISHFARPEVVCNSEAFTQALSVLIEQGVLNLTNEPGYGLWEHADSTEGLALTLSSLRTLASTHAALALSLHRAALARQLPGCPSSPHIGLCLHGHHGLGRGELARWWRQSTTNNAILADVFSCHRARLALIPAHDGHMLCPVFQHQLGITWWIVPVTTSTDHGLGLDELHYGRMVPEQGELLTRQDPLQSRHLWHQEWLGLLAIQLGCIDHAGEKAAAYAGIRYQGGKLIDQHEAVQSLLTDIRGVQADTETFLQYQQLDENSFRHLLLVRNRLQEGLGTAVNAAMQVMGGLGYMRDNGIEKCLRDAYQLRYQSGSPLDMQLLAASWERS
ncbi:MAG: acyl-CoA/acyl-ACP dehydrogenase [Pseudomonadales bacterium]|nr:acyl-CoA/acyl-ACP dehydrogenase [Pseudomonadales bacterium]